MANPTVEDLRCPQCRGAVREGMPWCTQCYATLLPVEAAQESPRLSAGVAPAPPRVAVQLLPEELREAARRWPCTACEALNPLDEDVCGSCGSPFLSGVRDAEPPLLALPGVGDVAALSRAQRLGLGSALVLVVVVLTALLALVTG